MDNSSPWCHEKQKYATLTAHEKGDGHVSVFVLHCFNARVFLLVVLVGLVVKITVGDVVDLIFKSYKTTTIASICLEFYE